MYDLVALILTAPLSYLGRNNKALALGCGLATFAVGCFMFALPKVRICLAGLTVWSAR